MRSFSGDLKGISYHMQKGIPVHADAYCVKWIAKKWICFLKAKTRDQVEVCD